MRLHYLQHVSFEGPAAIATYATARGWRIAGSHPYRGDPLPELEDFDLLVAMGGPMSVNDETKLSWLVPEKRLVRAAVHAGKSVLGVCLGAQMIASAMGARVYRAEKEIGWFPVQRVTQEGLGAELPETFVPLHWHGETFDLPLGAIRLAETDAVPNQAFQLGARTLGLQFHLEATSESVELMAQHVADEIESGGRHQQPPEAIRDRTPAACRPAHELLWALLDQLATGVP